MASAVNKLSSAFVTKCNKLGRFNDGGSLYLQVSQVSERITKSWLLKYKLHGRKREMGPGSINIYSLSEARERARQCRQLIDQGIDPIERRRDERAAATAELAKRMTFAEAAKGFLKDDRDWETRGPMGCDAARLRAAGSRPGASQHD
jgi:hypothetical protein